MYGVLLNPEHGGVIAAGEVTLSRDGHTGVLEVQQLHHQSEVDVPAVLELGTGEQFEVVIAETVPPTRRGRAVGFPTIWFFVRHRR